MLQSNCCRRCHETRLQGPTPFWTTSLLNTCPGQVYVGQGWFGTGHGTVIGNCHKTSSPMSSGCPLGTLIGGYLSGGKPMSDTHPAVLHMAPVLPNRSFCSGDALTLVTWSPSGCSWSHEPERLCEQLEPNTSLFWLRIYFVKLSLDVESTNPPDAMLAPIFTGYEHHRNCVGMANENTQCGSPGDAKTAKAMYPAALG